MRDLPKPLEGLREYNQFIICKLVPRATSETKMDKIPIDVRTGRPTSAHDKSAWMTIDEAMNYLNNNLVGRDHLLGFVFTKDDPWFFVDIDSCIDHHGNYSDLAQSIIARFPGAAMEVSSSGTGLHIFGYAQAIPHRCKRDDLHLELYTKDRFVAFGHLEYMTGDIYQDFTPHLASYINDYFKPLESMALTNAEWTDTPDPNWNGPDDDDELIKKMLSSASFKSKMGAGVAVKDLWECNLEVLAEHYPPDESSSMAYGGSNADAALAQHLAFWTGNNCERMLRLMNRSALVRPKWTKHKTYLNMTITGAKQRQSKFYQAKKTEVVNPEPEVSFGVSIVDAPGHQTQHVGFLDLKANGKPKATLPNFARLLDHFGIVLRYNAMKREPELMIPNEIVCEDGVNNDSITALRSLCNSVDFPTTEVDGFISRQSKRDIYHPAVDWIMSKPWDGIDRLDQLILTLDCDDYELAKMLTRKWSIAAVSHLFDQNPKSSGVLVLQGSQNAGKTRWLKSLCKGNKDLFKEGVSLNPHDKDSVKMCIDAWMVELGEVDSTFRRADIAALKAWITRDYDEFRSAFERKADKYVRRTIVSATVNPSDYLKDATGNRRYWTISVGPGMNPDHDVDMQQYWAQMKVEYDKGEEVTWLRDDEYARLCDYNEAHTVIDSYQEALHDAYDQNAERTRQMTVTEILVELGFTRDKAVDEARKWGGAIQKFLGTKSKRATRGNVYMMPQHKNPFATVKAQGRR